MWTFVVFLFAICGGAFGASCGFEDLRKSCHAWFDNRPSFPKTEGDLLDICPKILSHVDCVKNHVEKCGTEGISETENLDKYKAYMTKVCEEDSPIRDDIVKELPCIKESLGKSNYTCVELARNALHNYIEENNAESEGPHEHYGCVLVSAEVACIAAEFNQHCGEGARNVVLDAFFSTGYLDKLCDKDETETVLELVALLELAPPQKERISNVIRTFKEIEF